MTRQHWRARLRVRAPEDSDDIASIPRRLETVAGVTSVDLRAHTSPDETAVDLDLRVTTDPLPESAVADRLADAPETVEVSALESPRSLARYGPPP